jgi:hypothetical protein
VISRLVLAAGILVCVAGTAASEERPAARLSPPRRALAGVTAVVPGVIVPGTGHLVAGRTATGKLLLATGGGGLLATVAGFGGLFATGGSQRTAGPNIVLIYGGVGFWLGSVAADLYGLVAPSGGTGRPEKRPPRMSAEVGLRYVYDPTFDYRAVSFASVEGNWGKTRVTPAVWAAVDDSNVRFRAAVARVLRRDCDGSRLELEGAVTHHWFGSDGFSTTLGEVFLAGRLDLTTVAPDLTGAFFELGTGYALGAVSYEDAANEFTDLLLGRFAFGMYLGHEPGGFGELSIYYDHRHDDYAAGLKVSGLGSGPAGHFGVRASRGWSSGWGGAMDVQIGSALVVGASAIYRIGGGR